MSVNDSRLPSIAGLSGGPVREYAQIPLGRNTRLVKNIDEVSEDRLGAV